MLTKKREKIICTNPKNNSLWVDSGEGICFKKISKPKLELKDVTKDYSVIELEIDQKINLNEYDIILNLNGKKIIEDIDDSQVKYEETKTKYIFKISDLKSDTEMKFQAKIINVKYPTLKTEFSDELIFRTKCNSDLYTERICKTVGGKVLGPTELSEFGKVEDDKKDSDVTKWPFIKIPDDVNGNICGCKIMNDENEIKEWCKNNIYGNLDISNERYYNK